MQATYTQPPNASPTTPARPRATDADFARARDTVADITGARPPLLRPPYGVMSTAQNRRRQRLDRTTAETLLGHPLRSIPDAIEQTARSRDFAGYALFVPGGAEHSTVRLCGFIPADGVGRSIAVGAGPQAHYTLPAGMFGARYGLSGPSPAHRGQAAARTQDRRPARRPRGNTAAR